MPLQGFAARKAWGLLPSAPRKGKRSSKFVKKKDLPAIRNQLKNYERMKRLMGIWIDLATELSNLRLTKDTRRQEVREM